MLKPKKEIRHIRTVTDGRGREFKNFPGTTVPDAVELDINKTLDTTSDSFIMRVPNVRTGSISWDIEIDQLRGDGARFGINDDLEISLFEDKRSSDEATDLVMAGTITEIGADVSEEDNLFTVRGQSRTHELLSGFVPGVYNGRTSPEIILDVINNKLRYGPTAVEKRVYGAKNNEPLTVRLSSGRSVEITDDNSGSGHISASPRIVDNFKSISYTRTWQPAYKVLDEVSKEENTGDIGAGKYIFYIKNSKVKDEFQDEFGANYIQQLVWKPKPTDSSGSLARGVDFGVNQVSKETFDVINALIARGGTDVEGDPITTFVINSESVGENGFKFDYFSKPNIGHEIRLRERKQGKSLGSSFTSGYPNDLDSGGSWTFNTLETGSSVGGDTEDKANTEYNNAIRHEIRQITKREAQSIVDQLGEPRFRVDLELFQGDASWEVGEMIELEDPVMGWKDTSLEPMKKLRIEKINHTLDDSGWVTNLEIKQDPRGIKGID